MVSKYWDDFERRVEETVSSLKNNQDATIRRCSVYITNKCNFKCKYCNHQKNQEELSETNFLKILEKYGQKSIIHITGGEPSTIDWLYPLIKKCGKNYTINLNTNAFIPPPFEVLNRLKVSLDYFEEKYWDCLVGKAGAFKEVVKNIKEASKYSTTSITYTVTHDNYHKVVDFVKFCNREFKDLYAVFFSVYKGTNPLFVMTDEDVEIFFNDLLPILKNELLPESLSLLTETIDVKGRVLRSTRFPENIENTPCYLSMTERVISPKGDEYTCSHLFRDGIFSTNPIKYEKCKYGCNRRLVKFNQEVEEKLKVVG